MLRSSQSCHKQTRAQATADHADAIPAAVKIQRRERSRDCELLARRRHVDALGWGHDHSIDLNLGVTRQPLASYLQPAPVIRSLDQLYCSRIAAAEISGYRRAAVATAVDQH